MDYCLGSCRIKYGKHTRNHFIYFASTRYIDIDFDSDYSLWYQISVKNPKKAYYKAKKLVDKFLNRDIMVEDLVAAGFSHNIPEKLWKI